MSYSRVPNTNRMTSLKVDNLTDRTTPEDLKKLFEQFGDIFDVHIHRHHCTGENQGFAIVRFYNSTDAEEAMDALDRQLLDGNELCVQMAALAISSVDPDSSRSLSRSPRSLSPSRADRSSAPSSSAPCSSDCSHSRDDRSPRSLSPSRADRSSAPSSSAPCSSDCSHSRDDRFISVFCEDRKKNLEPEQRDLESVNVNEETDNIQAVEDVPGTEEEMMAWILKGAVSKPQRPENIKEYAKKMREFRESGDLGFD